ncbi:MAG: transporter substrate-binding domain-containing protein [Proteobacteria bacterium]|nr:transporter substrate-binding domain-containing protein [Pseudomonadota bacterium]
MTLTKLLAGAAIVAITATSAMAGEVVRMGTEGAYAPYNFINDNGEVDGYERELGDELCKRAGLECTWVTNDWDSIIPNLVSGNYDTIMAGMSITAERDEVIDFTSEYFPADPSSYVALSSADASATTGVVAAQTATIQAAYIAASDATVVEFATMEDTIAAVRNGEADSVLADHAALKDVVDASGGTLAFVGDDVAIGGGVGMGVRESDKELRDKFEAAIASMKADGSLNTMIAKWFDGRKAGY